MIKCLISIYGLLFFYTLVHSGVGNIPKIKDPIYDNLFCYTKDVSWSGNKLVTDKKVAYLSCEQSGFIAYINGEDSLKSEEVERIKKFLSSVRQILKIEGDFDYASMSIIDILWIEKGIYERRELNSQEHAMLLENMKKTVKSLLHELKVEKELLQQCDLSDENKSYLCHVFTIKNRMYELKETDSQNCSINTKKKLNGKQE